MAPATKRQVVLPQGLSGHHTSLSVHKDPWHQWEGLVVILVAIHIIAFAFWCYLFHKANQDRRRREAGGGGAAGGGGGGGSPRATDWRSPREILSQYQKTRLGKV